MILKLNKKIYPENYIKKAIKDFSQLGKFKLKQDKNYFIVEVKNISKNTKKFFADEFLNYVLSLIKNG